MFQYLYEFLASYHPLLPILVFYSMFAIFIFMLPGRLGIKLAMFYLAMVSLPELFFQATWLYLLFAIISGIVLGLVIYRVLT